MYVYMYVCMYVYMYVCIYVCMYVCMYVCIYVCTFVECYLASKSLNLNTQHKVEWVEVIRVTNSYIPQAEQHSPFVLTLLCLENVTIMYMYMYVL